MCNREELRDSRIRMMPDMHAAEGCTVGTSMTVGDRVNPAYVGGDIGCGMQVYRLDTPSVDLPRLDEAIRGCVPSGAAIFPSPNGAVHRVPLEKLRCYESISHQLVSRSFGTLGGGNHFIELEQGLDGALYLVIHSGSRRLGRDVALYHQAAAFFAALGMDGDEVRRKRLKPADIKTTLRPEDCFLSGYLLENYLHDMDIAVAYASESRRRMGEVILERLGITAADSFATIHNYVDTKARILRKGAVSAQKGERLLIPINMKDGSLLCEGRGNPDWNCTAPHGSGRVMKRSEAKETLSIEDYQREMAGIYSTSVGESTLDESPMAYRRMAEIETAIAPTAEVKDILTPLYNFKASSTAAIDEETRDGED
jgi:RNA-splicing ligase RtcB